MNKKKLIITLYVAIALSTASVVFAFDFDPGPPPPPNDTTPPVLSITSPSGTVYGSIQIKAHATDSVSGMYCVDFYLDTVFKGRDSSGSSGIYESIEFDSTDFDDGYHTIRVFAFDNDGNYAYKTRTILIDNVADPIPINKYAIIVAIGDYEPATWGGTNPLMTGLNPDLNYIRGHEDPDNGDEIVTDGDDDLWYDFLVNKQGWSASNIRFYGDSHSSDYPSYAGDATKTKIGEGLDWLASKSQHDIVAIILDGHGYMVEDVNGDPDYSGIITYDGYELTDSYVLNKMNSFTPETIFLFVDGCATGGFKAHASDSAYTNSARFFITTSSDYLGKAHATTHQYDHNGQYYTALNRAWTCFFTYFAFETSGTYCGSLADHTSLETIYTTMKTKYESWIDIAWSGDTDCKVHDGDSTESIRLWISWYYP